MSETKRTMENPPAGLKRAVLEASHSDDFTMALKEFKLISFYRAESYSTCPCSPRAIKSSIRIKNTITGTELVICGGCAKRYFPGIRFGELESSVLRVEKNPQCCINEFTIGYLFAQRAITMDVGREYLMISRKSRFVYFDEYKEMVNRMLLRLTSEMYAAILREIDERLVWAVIKEVRNVSPLAQIRRNLLEKGEVDRSILDGFPGRQYEPFKKYSYKDLQCGRALLDSYLGIRHIRPSLMFSLEERQKHGLPVEPEGYDISLKAREMKLFTTTPDGKKAYTVPPEMMPALQSPKWFISQKWKFPANIKKYKLKKRPPKEEPIEPEEQGRYVMGEDGLEYFEKLPQRKSSKKRKKVRREANNSSAWPSWGNEEDGKEAFGRIASAVEDFEVIEGLLLDDD